MTDGPTLVFIEVRLRTSSRYGAGFDTVTVDKRRKLIRTAQAWLAQEPATSNRACRFDVVSIGRDDRVTWIRDAFTVDP